ncbi:MAG: BatA domain-containing protein [Planctomycetia bacterium]|nr:BatA domain-containing protein [Planctomycetia bacterium]
MSFLNSITLWGSLAAAGVSIPIVIHLLSRYRSKVVPWAAMELLRRAMVVRARRVRIEDLLLLAMRCLAVLLVALALARPVQTGAGWVGEAKTSVVIGLDSSLSMAHEPGVQSRYDLAKQRVRDIVATLKPGDTVTLVLLGKRPLVRLHNVPSNDDRITTTLKAATPLGESVNLETCLEEIKRLIAENKTPNRECYLVTDAQAVTWQHVSPRVRETLKELGNSATTYFLPAGPETAENLAVTRLAFASGILRKGGTVRYIADIRNTGRREATKVPVRLLLGDESQASVVIDRIGPGETASVPLFAHFEKSGPVGISVQLGSKDPLPADNARYVAADIRDAVRVLCVESNPVAKSLHGETGFLSAALSARTSDSPGEGASTVQVETVASITPWASRLASQDIVVLANVPEITREQAAALDDFVRRGGGLMVFLGGRIDPTLLNGQMRDGAGAPILPAELAEPVGNLPAAGGGAAKTDQADGWPLAVEFPDHPITRLFSTLPAQQWADIKFRRYFKLAPRENARVLLRIAGSQDPMLVEQSLGRGRVLLFASSANRDWNDLAISPLYLMLWQQAATHLTRKASETPVEVPDKLTFDLPADVTAQTVAVRGPQGGEVSALVTTAGGRKVATADAPLPGIYTMRYSPNEPEIKMAANLDPDESAVAVLRGSALDTAVEQLSARLIDEKQDLQMAVREKRYGRELWRPLAGDRRGPNGSLRWLARHAAVDHAGRVRCVGGGAGDCAVPARAGIVEDAASCINAAEGSLLQPAAVAAVRPGAGAGT